MWGWISVVHFVVSHFCGDWMLHREKGSCKKGREALKIWVSNTSTLCGKQANHRFQFSIPDPGNVEIPFAIVYISFSVQGLVIGGCTRRTTYLRNFVFFPKALQAWPRNSIHWTIHTISLKLRSCFLSEGSLPVQVLFHALTGKRILLIYLWDADDD